MPFQKIHFSYTMFLLAITALAGSDRELKIPALQKLNREATVILQNEKGTRRFVHNPRRARQRFSPASTFKIPNTLILLKEGIIRNADAMVAWDGTQHEFPDWNQNQNLRSAFRVSCVWYYQMMARQLHREKYSRYLRDLHYGNAIVGKRIDEFWLDGSLRISAAEQIDFLRSLFAATTVFNAEQRQLLRELMRAEERAGYIVYAKTGWARSEKPQIGWYVGYVETRGDRYFFAINVDIEKDTDLPLRKEMLHLALSEAGIADK